MLYTDLFLCYHFLFFYFFAVLISLHVLLYTFLITCLHHFLAFCCLKSQQKAISSVVESCLGCHVSVLCLCVHKNGVPSKATVQNVLRVLREISTSLSQDKLLQSLSLTGHTNPSTA